MHSLEIHVQCNNYIISNNYSKKQYNTKQCMAFFFQIEALLSLKNAWLLHIFILDTKSTC